MRTSCAAPDRSSIGLLGLGIWLVWQSTWDEPSALTVLLAIFAGGVVAASAAAMHADRLPGFAAAWREVGAVLTLGALFVAALPFVDTDDFAWTTFLVVALVLAGLAALAGIALAPGNFRLEPLMALAIAAVGVALVLWEAGADADDVGALDWAHAAVGVAVYVGAAAWMAILGVQRDSRRLTWLATAALVVFTTVQSFAVFAEIVEGAWLFVLLGLIFAGTGWLADRARRELAKSLSDEADTEQAGAGR